MSIKYRIWKKFAFLTQPRMIWGYKRYDGIYLKNTRISNTTFIDNPDKLKIEDHVFIGHFNYIEASNGISIKEGCQITNFISITSHSSHFSIRLYGKHYVDFESHKGYIKGSVIIGKYTFVGPHCVIMPDTIIGKGSIVVAYSNVQGRFPDFSIIKGNPAKVVGDTRNLDSKYLKQNPELKDFYNEWAEKP
ncbi:MAG: acyltransferase [Bacteroidetes bacterium]|nr:acyltransferase [Bacteroidota bacterium]MBL7103235.1 acyltransferase [Bacteroidales bacterium]